MLTKPLMPTLAAISLLCAPSVAQELNLYSSRHYDTDERLYSEFEELTGITINRIEGKADELIARMQAEGMNSPADILLTVDATRLARAKAMGLLAPVESETLETRIPAHLQDADNEWFGFSTRARIIFYDRNDVSDPPQTYADLASPEYRGMICIRSSTNVYMQTLLAAIVTHEGQEAGIAVLEERMNTHRAEYRTDIARLAEDMAKRDAARYKSDANARWWQTAILIAALGIGLTVYGFVTAPH